MKHSIKTFSLLATATCLTLSSLSAVKTNPVGYVTETLPAGQHILSTPLVKGGVSSGVVSSVLGSDVTLTSPVAFDSTSPTYLIVKSGLATGEVETIVGSSGNTVTLENQIANLSPSDLYEVRSHFTVGDLTAAASGSGSLTNGDVITLYNPDGSSTNYSYNGGDWFLSGGGFSPVNEGIIFPNEGFVLSLNSETTFTFVGEVVTYPANVDLDNSTFFIVSNSDPSSKTGADSIGNVLSGLGNGSVVTVYSSDGSLSVAETYTLNNGNWFSSTGGFDPVEISIAAPAAVVVNSQSNSTVSIPPAFSN